MPNTYST